MGPTAHGVELPADHDLVRGRRGLLAVRAEDRSALASVGFGPDGGEETAPTELTGRRPLEGFAAGEHRYVVRRHRHGGLLRALTGERFADPARPFRELALAADLAERGFATPPVVAARAIRARPGGWYLALVTRRVEGAIDLAAAFEELRRGAGTVADRHRLARDLGDLVGRLHAAGFRHADLHPKNLLVDGDDRLWVLDLDRSRFEAQLTEAARLANLRRLLRSVRRTEGRGRPWIGPGDLRRFLGAYQRARGADPAGWRGAWRGIAAAVERRGVWHRIGWFLEGLFGRAGH